MAIRKRDGKWLVELRPKGKPGIYATFDNKLAAQQFEAEQKILLKKGRTLSNKTLDDACERYSREVSIEKAGARWEQVRLKKFQRDDLAFYLLHDITSDEIEHWITQRKKAGLANNSIRRELTLLSAVFEAAIKWRWTDKNPVREADKPKADAARTRRISESEMLRLTEAFGYREGEAVTNAWQALGVAFLLAVETGMRQGEIYALTWENVHLENRYVHLPRTKNGDRRDVPLSRKAVALLAQMRGLHPTKVFPFLQSSAGVQWRRALKMAGIEDLHFHDTRHEACSRLAQRFTMLELAKIIGHRDPRSLMIYYNPTASELAAKLD